MPFDVNAAKVDLASLSGAQDVRPEGRRRAVRAPQAARAHRSRRSTAAVTSAACARARSTCRASSASARRPSSRRTEMADEASAARRAARAAARGIAVASSTETLRQRLAGAPAAGQPQHLVRLRRGRGAADGAQGRRGVVGLGVHVGVARAELRAARARRRRRAGAHVDPLRPRPLQHRGRGRLRGRARRRQRSSSCASCRRCRRWPRRASISSPSSGPRTEDTRRQSWRTSEKVIEHYENPRNVGTLDKDDDDVGTGLVGAPACGDVMRLQIKVEDGIIEDAKFKTFGCGSAIASSSLATEWVKGMTHRPGDGASRTRRSSRS